jgi:hypothetical protein
MTGVLRADDGSVAHPVETVTYTIYDQQTGGAPLWQETQNVNVDAEGRYSLLLGAVTRDGIPSGIFVAGESRWVGVQWGSHAETARTLLTSAPYALNAASADTLAGRPATDFLLSPTGRARTTVNTGTTTASGATSFVTTASLGTSGHIGKFFNSTDLGDSVMFESAGMIGLGTTAPLDIFHAQFTNNSGALTGIAVQNLGNTATSYSGMLFYDQNGALGQFQGFNNVTHEYRINNIAQNAGLFNGSINFMIGSSSKFLVDSNGNVGIGTTTPNTGINNVSGRLSIAAPSADENAVFVRKPTGTFDYAIQARADAGVNGPAIGGVAGYADGVGIAPTSSVAVFGAQANANGNAVQAYNATVSGAALFASGGQFAGDFSGNVRVTGNLTVTGSVSKGSGSFTIDHPLDPANKYLSHSFVESPDMMNVYNGNVTLDANGEAIVILPDWFEALNRDFRYQLTALGAPGPNLYIAEEVANGRFKIGGGAGSGRVSWQVTGIRHDAFADAHRIAIEEDKPAAERGHYLYPELYGQPADTRIGPGTTVTKDQ